MCTWHELFFGGADSPCIGDWRYWTAALVVMVAVYFAFHWQDARRKL